MTLASSSDRRLTDAKLVLVIRWFFLLLAFFVFSVWPSEELTDSGPNSSRPGTSRGMSEVGRAGADGWLFDWARVFDSIAVAEDHPTFSASQKPESGWLPANRFQNH